MALNFSSNRTKLWGFQNIPNYEDSYSKNYSKKTTQNSKKNSKNKTILRIRMLVNTGPGLIVCLPMWFG